MFPMNVDGGGFEFAGMRLVNISFAFEGDGIGGGNPPDYFAFSFCDPAESQMVSGCLMENLSGAPINFTVDFQWRAGFGILRTFRPYRNFCPELIWTESILSATETSSFRTAA